MHVRVRVCVLSLFHVCVCHGARVCVCVCVASFVSVFVFPFHVYSQASMAASQAYYSKLTEEELVSGVCIPELCVCNRQHTIAS